MKNPLNLTTHQCKVLDSLTRLGCAKLVAIELGFARKGYVSAVLGRACKRAGVKGKLLLALEFDRARRGKA